MKTKKRILPALVLSAFAAFGAAEAQSAQFTAVYAFGDSLSDAGYVQGRSGIDESGANAMLSVRF